MSTKPATNLRFEASEDMGYLKKEALNVFMAAVIRKKLPVPEPQPILFSKVAKTKDGRVVGGIVGLSQWNYLEITHLAVDPDFRNRGVGTALMKCAEEAARGELICNQIHVAVLDFQPHQFFEKFGFKVHWTVPNCPRSHATHHMAKEWPLGFRDEPATGYDGAMKGVVFEDENVEKATAQLNDWIYADMARLGVQDVPPRSDVIYGLKALRPDGSLAAVCIYQICWNVLYVHVLTVAKGGKKRGVGSAVLRKIDEIACEHNCDYVMLHTMNWQARPFYEKNGFVCVAKQDNLPFMFHRFVMLRTLSKLPQSNL